LIGNINKGEPRLRQLMQQSPGNALHILNIEPDGNVTENANSPIILTVPSGTRPRGVSTVSLP
jgi:hypothetical protein